MLRSLTGLVFPSLDRATGTTVARAEAIHHQAAAQTLVIVRRFTIGAMLRRGGGQGTGYGDRDDAFVYRPLISEGPGWWAGRLRRSRR
jgi:hypothetical protein